MTAPVLDSVTPAGPVNAVVGSKVTFTLAAHDADARTETLTFSVTDQAGASSNTQSAQIIWSDPLTPHMTSDKTPPSPVVFTGLTAQVG